MRKHATICAATIAAFFVGTTPVQASVSMKKLEGRYTALRHAVIKRNGARAAGRNIRKYGVRSPHGRVFKAKGLHYARSIRTYRRWLAPPVPSAMPVDRVPVGRIASAPALAGGKWAIPASIVMCESHGNYNAVNSSSGAGGAYQILPSTWRAYGGTGSPNTAPPAEQDRIAAKVWAGQGRGAWVC